MNQLMNKKMKSIYQKISFVLLLLCMAFLSSYSCKSDEGNEPLVPADTTPVKTDISFWLTKPDKSALLQKQDVSLLFNSKVNSFPTIDIDTSVTYQVMDGFGFTLTGGSATLINGLSAPVFFFLYALCR